MHAHQECKTHVVQVVDPQAGALPALVVPHMAIPLLTVGTQRACVGGPDHSHEASLAKKGAETAASTKSGFSPQHSQPRTPTCVALGTLQRPVGRIEVPPQGRDVHRDDSCCILILSQPAVRSCVDA